MITAYLDQYKSLDEQITLYKELNLTSMPLRKLNGESIYYKDDSFLDALKSTFKEQKITISNLDIDITYSLMEIIDLDRVFYIAKVLGVKEVLLKLPTLEDFNIERNLFTEKIKEIMTSFKKERINLSFHVNYEIDSAYIAYLINEFKDIKFIFNPAECYFYDKAVSTYHRLLKNNLTYVILYDLNENKEIALLGYGSAFIIDTLDRMIVDKYKGDVLLDTNLLEYIDNRKSIYSKLFKLPFFRNNKSKKAYEEIEHKLKLTEEDNITFKDLYSSQISLVKRYLK